LADAARSEARGQDARGGPLEPQSRAAGARRGARTRRHAAAAVLADPARRERRRVAVVREPRDRRDRLQPDAVGTAHRIVLGRTRRRADVGRLALTLAGVSTASL